MYCYIQEIQMKNSYSKGGGKEIIVTTTEWTVNGVPGKNYGYIFSDDNYERQIKTAYKISIHDKSYRDENGRVRKRQYYLTTIKYYDLVDYRWSDCIVESKVDEIAENLGIDSDSLWDEIEEKLDLLSEKVSSEFRKTEEYRTKEKHDAIIKEYRNHKHEFAKKHEIQESEYDKCFDVFGVLRNPEYLKKIQADYKTRKEYEKKSRSYQQDYYSNYKSYSGNSGNGLSNNGLNTEKEIRYYKKFYRVLAQKFHPDVTGENETMQFINKLKEQWGV